MTGSSDQGGFDRLRTAARIGALVSAWLLAAVMTASVWQRVSGWAEGAATYASRGLDPSVYPLLTVAQAAAVVGLVLRRSRMAAGLTLATVLTSAVAFRTLAQSGEFRASDPWVLAIAAAAAVVAGLQAFAGGGRLPTRGSA